MYLMHRFGFYISIFLKVIIKWTTLNIYEKLMCLMLIILFVLNTVGNTLNKYRILSKLGRIQNVVHVYLTLTYNLCNVTFFLCHKLSITHTLEFCCGYVWFTFESDEAKFIRTWWLEMFVREASRVEFIVHDSFVFDP